MSDEVYGMAPTEEQIKMERDERVLRILEEYPVEELVAVPTVPKRCLVPCAVGRCNCVEMYHGHSIVHESMKADAIREANEALAGLNRSFRKEFGR